MADRFDKFTDRARRVLTYAQEEAQRFNHNYIGTEHLLLALLREDDTVASKVLSGVGVRLDAVRSSVEFIVGRGGNPAIGEIGLTPRAKKVIELSVDEARRLKHHYIGTEHLLLGIIREGEGIAAGVLKSLGVELAGVRAETERILREIEQPHYEDAPATVGPEPPATTALEDVGASTPAILRLTPRARRAFELATSEAKRLNHTYVGTEHLLLGILAEGDNIATGLLKSMGVDANRLRGAVESIIGPAQPEGEQ